MLGAIATVRARNTKIHKGLKSATDARFARSGNHPRHVQAVLPPLSAQEPRQSESAMRDLCCVSGRDRKAPEATSPWQSSGFHTPP